MRPRSTLRAPILFAALGGLVALAVAWAGSSMLALGAGLVCLALALTLAVVVARAAAADEGAVDPGRRRLLLTGLGGLGWLLGGVGLGRAARQLSLGEPRPVQEAMARDLGAEYLELIRRAYHPDRSGDLQLVLAPFNSSNYPQESLSLVPRDPRTSHAAVWMYLERVPLVVRAPGSIVPGVSAERVTLADVASTIAELVGFDGFGDLGRDGRPLPGVSRPATPPRVVVTFVIDGGGWNVLRAWPESWPNLRRLLGEGMSYRNAIVGSFPAVTASAHATIGTGAFPDVHGITGHNIRDGRKVRKAYGEPGRARPDDILVPTLADLWSDETGNRAWVGELGYQVWHLGMIGRGGAGRTGDDRPVAVHWDERGLPRRWASLNPDLYRLPSGLPGLEALAAYRASFVPPDVDAEFDPSGRQVECCDPPIVAYQGDLIEATLRSEPVGRTGVSDLLFVNFKAPDYAGHLYNMSSERTRLALEAVDAQLGRIARLLDELFPREHVLIVTADHGQCPLPEDAAGVRLDPIQLGEAIEREFGRGLFPVVQNVVPSEVYLHADVLWDAGVTREDVAAFLADYRYRQNLGPYVPRDAIERDLLARKEFAAVFATTFLEDLRGRDLSTFGDTAYPEAELEVPPIG